MERLKSNTLVVVLIACFATGAAVAGVVGWLMQQRIDNQVQKHEIEVATLKSEHARELLELQSSIPSGEQPAEQVPSMVLQLVNLDTDKFIPLELDEYGVQVSQDIQIRVKTPDAESKIFRWWVDPETHKTQFGEEIPQGNKVKFTTPEYVPEETISVHVCELDESVKCVEGSQRTARLRLNPE